MAGQHERGLRAAATLMNGVHEELTAELVYEDLHELGYQFPLGCKGDARHLVTAMSDLIAREKLAKSFIPGLRTAWNLDIASNLADAALMRDDILTAYWSATYYDAVHPLNRFRNWQQAQNQVLWAGYMAVMPEVGIDASEYS